MEMKLCPECGASLNGVTTCKAYFDRMIAWDFCDFTGVGRVHHLTVLCYYLQHPRHYSSEGLKESINILKKVIENNLSDKKIYQEESTRFSSAKRTWSVRGTESNYGKYSREITWSVTVDAVVKDGITKYPEHIVQWAKSIYSDLKNAGQLS